ncbi:endonuclease domain-containing protein [Sinomonas atrocyanea]
MDALDYLRSLGGVARTATLLRAGASKREVAAVAALGAKPAHGIIALPDCNPDYLFALVHNGLLTCGSAATAHGLWIRDVPLRRHLAVAHSRVTVFTAHRTLRFPAHGTLPIASLEDTVLHALGCLPLAEAVSMAECAIRGGQVDRGMLEDLLRGPRSTRARRALSLVTATAESQPEVDARLLFVARGWRVQVQARIPGVGRVDLLIEGLVIVEIDGHAFHADRAAFVEDRRRQNEALRQGYPTLRYPPEVVWRDPDRLLRDVEELLRIWGPRRFGG